MIFAEESSESTSEEILCNVIKKSCEIDDANLEVVTRILDSGASAMKSLVWIRNELHRIQQSISCQDDYIPFALQVKRMAKAFDQLAAHPEVPRLWLRFAKWNEISALFWDFNPEIEELVWSDFKIQSSYLK